ncbi:MAG: hypothetical protein ABIF19_10320 [Planctomycetota bacterium]
MVLEQGERVHVIFRRLFEMDLRRHFIGEIVAVGDSTVKVRGRAVVLDSTTNQYEIKADTRTRIVSLTDALNVINILPPEASIDDVKYVMSHDKRLTVTDGETFTLDINEFSTVR